MHVHRSKPRTDFGQAKALKGMQSNSHEVEGGEACAPSVRGAVLGHSENVKAWVLD